MTWLRRVRPPRVAFVHFGPIVFGAIISIAVAWGFAVREDSTGKSNATQRRLLLPAGITPGEWNWLVSHHHEGPGHDLCILRLAGSGSDATALESITPEDLPAWVGVPDGGRRGMYMRSDAYGWPCAALFGQDRGTGHARHIWRIDRGTGAAPWWLPTGILWRGFAANSVVYAVICWIIVATPFALRRRLRLRRGLCPHCAYPIGTSGVCTECGRPVRPGHATIDRVVQ
jgi:hypothetical protein